MHYKNGREAKVGDHIVGKGTGGNAVGGILVTANQQSDTCNGQIISGAELYALPYVTLKDCLHVDDAFPAPAAAPAQ